MFKDDSEFDDTGLIKDVRPRKEEASLRSEKKDEEPDETAQLIKEAGEERYREFMDESLQELGFGRDVINKFREGLNDTIQEMSIKLGVGEGEKRDEAGKSRILNARENDSEEVIKQLKFIVEETVKTLKEKVEDGKKITVPNFVDELEEHIKNTGELSREVNELLILNLISKFRKGINT